MAVDITSDGLKKAPRLVGVGVVAIYRAAISPVIHALNGPACRFEPSCSEYAREAIARHGMVRGGAMAIWRIARCNPVGGHGFDPVPDRIVNRRCEEQNPESRAQGTPSPAPRRGLSRNRAGEAGNQWRGTRHPNSTLTFILSLARRGDSIRNYFGY